MKTKERVTGGARCGLGVGSGFVDSSHSPFLALGAPGVGVRALNFLALCHSTRVMVSHYCRKVGNKSKLPSCWLDEHVLSTPSGFLESWVRDCEQTLSKLSSTRCGLRVSGQERYPDVQDIESHQSPPFTIVVARDQLHANYAAT